MCAMTVTPQALRKMLDSRGLRHTQIVAADLLPIDCWDIAKDITRDAELRAAVSILG